MTTALGLYIGIFAAVLVALIARKRLTNHVMLGVAGALGLLYGMTAHGMLAVILPFLILIVAGVQAVSVIGANRQARFIASSFSRRLTLKLCSSAWRASGLAAR